MDEIDSIFCSDCGAKCRFSFTLAFRGQPFLVSIAACKRCRKNGDDRSLWAKTRVDAAAWKSAVMNGLPSVEVRP